MRDAGNIAYFFMQIYLRHFLQCSEITSPYEPEHFKHSEFSGKRRSQSTLEICLKLLWPTLQKLEICNFPVISPIRLFLKFFFNSLRLHQISLEN